MLRKDTNTSYSASAYLKAAAVFATTTGIFLFAKTTGLLPSWLWGSNKEKEANNQVTTVVAGNNQDSLVLVSSNSNLSILSDATPLEFTELALTDVANVPAAESYRTADQTTTLIPNQVIDATTTYSYAINGKAIFGEDVQLLTITQKNQDLPAWLNFYPSFYTWDTSGYVNDISVVENIAYVAKSDGLEIFNITFLAKPVSLSNFTTLDYVVAVATSGDIACLAESGGSIFNGIQILNTRNPRRPFLLNNYNMGVIPPIYTDIALTASNLFIITNDDGPRIQVISIVDITHPSFLTSYNFSSNPIGIDITDDAIMYIAEWSDRARSSFNGLQIFDISRPLYPRILSNYSTLGSGYGVKVIADDLVLISQSGFNGFQIVNKSNLLYPTLFGTYAAPYGSMAAQGYTLLVANSEVEGIQVIDLTKGILSGTPTINNFGQTYTLLITGMDEWGNFISTMCNLTVDQFPRSITNTLADKNIFPGSTWSLPFSTKTLFTNPSQSFTSVSAYANDEQQSSPGWLTLLSTPVLQGSYPTSDWVNTFVLEENTAFLASCNSGLEIVDISNLARPNLLYRYTTSGCVFQVVLAPTNRAFISILPLGTNERMGLLQIFDVTRPEASFLLGNYTSPGWILGIEMADNIAYLLEGHTDEGPEDTFNGIEIVNMTDSENPMPLGRYASVGRVRAFKLFPNNILYLYEESGAFRGLQILSTANLTHPIVLGNYSTQGGAGAIGVAGDIAYIGQRDIAYIGKNKMFPGLLMLNVSNPSLPVFLTSYQTVGGVSAIEIYGSIMIVANGDSGIQIFNITNPFNIIDLSNYLTPDFASDAQLLGNNGFVSLYGDAFSGLQIIDLTQYTFTATPTVADAGNYEIVVAVTDVLGGIATQSFKIRVEGPPRFNSTIPILYAKVGQPFNYFIPQGLFFDPNFDPIFYSAALAITGKPLPAWLSFNGGAAIFAGVPQTAGNITIALTATDNIAGNVTAILTLSVTRPPQLNQGIQSPAAEINKFYQLQIQRNTFTDLDGLPLTYMASLTDGLRLPTWLIFNPNNLTFMGLPSLNDTGQLIIKVVASDPQNAQISTSFTLNVNPSYPPEIINPISDLIATVGQAFKFVMPTNTFIDANDDPMTYSASLVDEDDLPSWLQFDPDSRTFFGTPTPGDTNFYRERILSVALTAHAGQLSDSTVFRINVIGKSYGEWIVTIVGPLISAYGIYSKRALFLNYCNENKHCWNKNGYKHLASEPPDPVDTLSQYTLRTDVRKVGPVQAMFKRPNVNCYKFWEDSWIRMPGGKLLPSWLEYDEGSNTLHCKGSNLRQAYLDLRTKLGGVGDLIIQVKDSDGIIREQFPLALDGNDFSISLQPGSVGASVELSEVGGDEAKHGGGGAGVRNKGSRNSFFASAAVAPAASNSDDDDQSRRHGYRSMDG